MAGTSIRDDDFYHAVLVAANEVLKMDNLHAGQKVLTINLLTTYEHSIDRIMVVARKANAIPMAPHLEALVTLAHQLDEEADALEEGEDERLEKDPREVRDPREERIVRIQTQTM